MVGVPRENDVSSMLVIVRVLRKIHLAVRISINSNMDLAVPDHCILLFGWLAIV
jgi:hypothetical protein